jgi:hypothetical protein
MKKYTCEKSPPPCKLIYNLFELFDFFHLNLFNDRITLSSITSKIFMSSKQSTKSSHSKLSFVVLVQILEGTFYISR